MVEPRYVNIGDAAAGQKSAFTCPRLFISSMCEIAFMVWIMVTPWYYLFYDLPPRFSVQLAPLGDQSLDMAAAAAPIASAFHVALHASNERATERCYRNGEVAVMFSGFTIASGRIPGFCVPGKVQREVPFLVTREEGVGLPEHLRDRMAAARKVGALELEVQVSLVNAGRPMRMWCHARMGGAQPLDVTVCTVFALQNWFHFGG
ncbi:hypothetical protein PR202_gb04997 [Eleusine coracana subsp. coracana]|uniref:Uncharacterized protein n=1 Tax=Eleusine coracana subsp. coracana TaxID=191504 RepID=A0AAV5E5X6_ELECO|nr:hypothetical protein QOZ80_1BG0080830 [Eleusine coracana subsp. coracana]GJN17891.1 hypothetical protein PR202_gb04997 [Eleusine coracana subsp. coracana]